MPRSSNRYATPLAGLTLALAAACAAQTTRPAPLPGPMARQEIEAGLRSRDRALHVKAGWIRDPFIVHGPDDTYYLTGTTPAADDAREGTDPYNNGLGPKSIVGSAVRVWTSRDLIDWQETDPPFVLGRDSWYAKQGRRPGNLVWAPELHWLGDRWALLQCPAAKANFALTAGAELKGPWAYPMGAGFGEKHDPSLFKDGDTWWMIWGNGDLAPLSPDLSHFTAEPVHLDPAGTRPGPDGKPVRRIGHEGTLLMKVGAKYVFFGTAWSTDVGRRGSYNLYYCTADRVTGPYGPRRFAGRFLGHGTPFRTQDGQWWCTAFYNGEVPPLSREGIATRDLSSTAQTINPRGTTIVPLDIRTTPDGDVSVRALDPAYATPGPDEAQKFTD